MPDFCLVLFGTTFQHRTLPISYAWSVGKGPTTSLGYSGCFYAFLQIETTNVNQMRVNKRHKPVPSRVKRLNYNKEGLLDMHSSSFRFYLGQAFLDRVNEEELCWSSTPLPRFS